jgi:hypothetical protein
MSIWRLVTRLLGPGHEGWDYEPRLSAVLKHFRAWAKRP